MSAQGSKRVATWSRLQIYKTGLERVRTDIRTQAGKREVCESKQNVHVTIRKISVDSRGQLEKQGTGNGKRETGTGTGKLE